MQNAKCKMQNAKFLLAIIHAQNEPALIIICVMFYTKKDKRGYLWNQTKNQPERKQSKISEHI